MTTPVKVKTNRRNSLASTGPTSNEGKAIVAANALQHGLLSWKPVVAGFESEQEWDAHHQQTLLDLRPEGHLETVLAERIALLLWRLGRVARFELEAIATGLEDAEGAWNRFHMRGHSPLTKLAEKIAEAPRKLDLLKQLSKVADDQHLDPELVAAVLNAAAEVAGVQIYNDGEGKPDVSLPEFPEGARLDEVDWTTARARAALEAIAQGAQGTLNDLLNRLMADAQSDLDDKKSQHKAQEADLDRFRRRMLLADEPTMERVRRYETTFERAMLRCLHELQRLQASRQGQAVPAPVVLDVNLSGDGD
jgi:hypothetical protein